MVFKLNNKGFSLREFIAVLLVMVIVTLVVLNVFFKGNKNLPYKNFRNLAKDFSINATSLRDSDPKYHNRVFLVDTIKNNYSHELSNPFNKKENCDKYESKVVFDEANKKKITLKCGNYLIFNEDGFSSADGYTIYKVSKWSEKVITGGNVQTQTFYNYSLDGNLVLDKYLIEKEFLETYSSKTGNNILSLSQVDTDKYTIEKKTYYRTMEEVD